MNIQILTHGWFLFQGFAIMIYVASVTKFIITLNIPTNI